MSIKAAVLLFLAIFLSVGFSTQSFGEKEGQNWVITGSGYDGGTFDIVVTFEDNADFEHIEKGRVYRLASITKSGKELEVRYFDVDRRDIQGASGKRSGKEKKEMPTKKSQLRFFTIFMKKLPGIDRFRLTRDGKLEDEKPVPSSAKK